MTMTGKNNQLDAPDEHSAAEALHALGCTDGLPIVVPTPERVARLVLATGMDGELSLGAMGPSFGAATVEKICVSAVMAGCLPDHMPVVVAAVRAILTPEFDLTEVQATTHCISPLVLVHGAAREFCGVASGFGALGPGHRANMCIGRALRLAMINIGGARPGVSDMALLGHPGKLSMVLAEDQESSPFPPLHTSFGFAQDDAAITVVGTEGPHSVVWVNDADDPDSPDRLLRSLGQAVGNLASNNAHFRRGTAVVVLNPEHASVLATAGLTRRMVQDRLLETSSHRRSELRRLNPTFAGPGSDDDVIAPFQTSDDILVLTAGGAGLYSTVFPSWGAGRHGNRPITVPVDIGQACEIPARPRSDTWS
jgi:hypothetical protein